MMLSSLVKYVKKTFDKDRKLYIVLTAFELTVIFTSLFFFIYTYRRYKVAEQVYDHAVEKYVTVKQSAKDTASNNESESNKDSVKSDILDETDDNNWWDSVTIDLDSLKGNYPEAIGWLYFENGEISYPIMYSGDNEKYLKTAYDGTASNAGSVFLDCESTVDFSDAHSLIYGHNMRNGSMFAKLGYYISDPDYYSEHQYFQIFCGDHIYRYQIFAYGAVSVTHDVYEVYGEKPQGLSSLFEEFTDSYYYNKDIVLDDSDHVVTLSTCNGDVNSRMIVCAVRVDEHRESD